jgi:hypothetical protein
MDNCTGCGKQISERSAWTYGVRCRECFLADGERDREEMRLRFRENVAASRQGIDVELSPYQQHVQEEREHWFIGDEHWLANN